MKSSHIRKIAEEVISGRTNSLQLFFDANDILSKLNKRNPISLNTIEYNHIDNPKSILNGIIYSLKDNIATKNIITTGGSKFLEKYQPKYNATVKTLLDNAGAICISKDNLDEFGLGGNGTFSAYGIVHNNYDPMRIAGGSSSGSSVMVASGIVPFAIATDTGDSIRRPASLQGIVGFKPSYGRISRYGVFPYAPSLDHVGILSKSVYDAAIIMQYIAQYDCLDMTSIKTDIEFINGLKQKNNYKLVMLQEAFDAMLEDEKKLFNLYLKDLTKKGYKITFEYFSKQLLELIDPIYKTISYAEATTCWANLNGILFGGSTMGNNFSEILKSNRSKYFGKQLKRRFVIGAFATNKNNYESIFLASKKIRTLIINRANELFTKYDAIICPGSSRIAPLIEDELNKLETTNICDDALQIANFGGFPSLTIPAIKYKHLFVGLNITCPLGKDLETLNIGLNISGEWDA